MHYFLKYFQDSAEENMSTKHMYTRIYGVFECVSVCVFSNASFTPSNALGTGDLETIYL